MDFVEARDNYYMGGEKNTSLNSEIIEMLRHEGCAWRIVPSY